MNLLLAADLSLHYENAASITEECAAQALREVVPLFAKADFSMLNLENIFGNVSDYTPIVKTGPNLISPDASIAYLNALRPTVIGLANNHSGDFGEKALFHTVDLLEKHGYQTVGAGKTIDDAYRPVRFEKDGIAVSVLAVCENEFGCADTKKGGAAGFALTRVAHALAAERTAGYLPIVYFHGGNEHNPFPSPEKVTLYRYFAELGAAAVVAMHTHCPQGYEVYRGVPIVYSMGNFYFPDHDTKALSSWKNGYLTNLTIDRSGAQIETVPYFFDADGIHLYRGESLDKFRAYLKTLSAPIGDPERLRLLFDGWCRISGVKYARHAVFSEEMLTDGAKLSREMRNVFSCEAHNELLKNTLQMCYDGRVNDPDVVAAEETIRQLQNAEF